MEWKKSVRVRGRQRCYACQQAVDACDRDNAEATRCLVEAEPWSGIRDVQMR
jgi:hypothetical protein